MSSPSVIEYFILAVLLSAAIAALVVGMRRHRLRVAQGRAEADGGTGSKRIFGRDINPGAFVHRALLTEQLWKRPVAGLAHALLLGGAVLEILGHGSFAFSFVGADVYAGWFGTVVMRWGRELAGLAMLLGVTFFLVRRLGRYERLVKGGERKGFVPMEVLLLVTIVAGFVAEAFRLTALSQPSSGEFVGNALAAGLRGLGAGTVARGDMLMWWGHGLLGLAFITLIAYTPLSHMLLGSANSALARRPPASSSRRSISTPRRASWPGRAPRRSAAEEPVRYVRLRWLRAVSGGLSGGADGQGAVAQDGHADLRRLSCAGQGGRSATDRGHP